jgi:hypothetical protein
VHDVQESRTLKSACHAEKENCLLLSVYLIVRGTACCKACVGTEGKLPGHKRVLLYKEKPPDAKHVHLPKENCIVKSV